MQFVPDPNNAVLYDKSVQYLRCGVWKEVGKHELEQQTRRQLLIPTLEARQSEKQRASQGCTYLQVDPSDDVEVTR